MSARWTAAGRAALILALPLALSACGTPWRGGTTAPVAPVAVADIALVPTVAEETTSLTLETPQGATGGAIVPDGSTGALLPNAPVAVAPTGAPTLDLSPTAPTGVTVVAPIVPETTTSLASGGSGQAGATVAAAPNPPAPTATSLPPRPAGSGSERNPVAFALATSHAVGTPVYARPPGGGGNPGACARYSSAIAAQEAFLGAGGPENDRLGLDPDGDGYACAWDPGVYRQAVGG